ncbi:DUF4856 domain-containing protein [Luteibaculum oceani]|uniref:DUF4856 domain-containing protein n=1 Tax=Luteibaculum oceani TaxID=1294296 RepID=A0A5C6UUB5_9FLAO|nr:DUF4856 domain-containing protein [Luteibaculum oceani]TXC76963.1 DUF4856 domain-containing protein [Luteibaculum oceani]
MKKLTLLTALFSAVAFTACQPDEKPQTSTPTAPSTYSFTRNGESTVSYTGQEERIAMLTAIGSYLGNVNTGGTVNASQLKDMFANSNGAFATEGYSKQLKNKCASVEDAAFYEAWFEKTDSISKLQATAANGKAGLLLKEGSSSGYLFDENGLEPRQIILKGLMGSVFYYQTVEHYLSVNILADDNNNIVEGKNYTQMEHHYDEAFGYLGIAPDLSNADTDPKDQTRVNFWGEYVVKRHVANDSYNMPGINERLLNALIKGRHAIVLKQYDNRDAAIAEISIILEQVCANNALAYLEDAKDDTDVAARLHHLSEAVGFMIAMEGHRDGAISEALFPRKSNQAKVDSALAIVGLNSNLWEVSNSDIDMAITHLVEAFGNNPLK